MPVFNEGNCIERVLTEVWDILAKTSISYEILVIDDASTDKSPEILARLSKINSNLRTVTQSYNQGIAGFNRRVLTEAQGEWIFIASSDGESDYNDIPLFLNTAESKNLWAVLGCRRKKNYSLYRNIVSSSFGLLVALLFGAYFQDLGWIRLVKRELFAGLPQHCNSAFAMAEQLLVARKYGARFEEFKVAHRQRYSGRGSGARPKKVVSAVAELLETRMRFFEFSKYYQRKI